MIPITKPYFPKREKFINFVDRIYESGWLTNNGPLVGALEDKLKQYLGVNHLILVANGSLALQVAYKALNLTGEVITTPFSFPATASTIYWEGLKPVFADIDNKTFNLDPFEIEDLITSDTSAIVPVHVYGNPCEIDSIKAIANRRKLKVIYDAAHAFGVNYKGKSVLNYGDISTISFHATKIFHTIEGGAVITNDIEIANKVRLLINFGITGPSEVETLGTNAKMNELQAAMGLCILAEMKNISSERQRIWEQYYETLSGLFDFQLRNPYATQNYGYVPILFKNEATLLRVEKAMNEKQIFPRRYFYPSLDMLKYLQPQKPCTISRDIASRILCLPSYSNLVHSEIESIMNILKEKL